MSSRLLMIEDDGRLARMVGEYLVESGFAFAHAADGLSGLARLQEEAPDLVILDLMLPDIDGLDVCRRIRALPGDGARTPILMLTAKGDPMDRIVGLELGADDYLPKPFEPRELLARIRAVLRRHHEGPSAAAQALRFGSLEIDRDARTVSVRGAACELTSYQFDLLVALAERAGRVLTRDQIMEAVRGRELEAFDRSIDVHMGRIRAAIEADVKAPETHPDGAWGRLRVCTPARLGDMAPTFPHCVWSLDVPQPEATALCAVRMCAGTSRAAALPPGGLALLGAARRCGACSVRVAPWPCFLPSPVASTCASGWPWWPAWRC
jgi:two-component system phosphate regulon response regulator OmpR